MLSYAEKLENLSLRLPFDYTLFLETFADFLTIYHNSNKKDGLQLIYERYKPIATYVIRLNSKLIDGGLIPDRIAEFKMIIKYRKDNVSEYYRRNLLTIDEMQSILHSIDNDKISILNQAIGYRVNFVSQNPTFKNVNEVIKMAKFIQREIPDIDLIDAYKWRAKMRRKIIFSTLCAGMCFAHP